MYSRSNLSLASNYSLESKCYFLCKYCNLVYVETTIIDCVSWKVDVLDRKFFSLILVVPIECCRRVELFPQERWSDCFVVVHDLKFGSKGLEPNFSSYTAMRVSNENSPMYFHEIVAPLFSYDIIFNFASVLTNEGFAISSS